MNQRKTVWHFPEGVADHSEGLPHLSLRRRRGYPGNNATHLTYPEGVVEAPTRYPHP